MHKANTRRGILQAYRKRKNSSDVSPKKFFLPRIFSTQKFFARTESLTEFRAQREISAERIINQHADFRRINLAASVQNRFVRQNVDNLRRDAGKAVIANKLDQRAFDNKFVAVDYRRVDVVAFGCRQTCAGELVGDFVSADRLEIIRLRQFSLATPKRNLICRNEKAPTRRRGGVSRFIFSADGESNIREFSVWFSASLWVSLRRF